MTDSPFLHLEPLDFVWKTRDPFLFCVHHDDRYPAGNESLGPAASLAGRNLGNDFEPKDGWRMYHGERVPGFPAHPHRGFETVTVVRRGLIDHSDSLGAAARYGGGDVQWLTAGRGIQHAEMFPLLEPARDNPLELFQIWLNLPAADKMAEPHFSMIWNHDVPRWRGEGVEVTIIAGALDGSAPPPPPPASWAARADSAVGIWIVRLSPGARWRLPAAVAGINRCLYHFEGRALRAAGLAFPEAHLAVVPPDVALDLEAGDTGSQLLVLQGRPIGEPVAQYGPFVMNTRAQLQQAFDDYQRTQFGGWPWPGPDPVHGREGRFAHHADGRVERPPGT